MVKAPTSSQPHRNKQAAKKPSLKDEPTSFAEGDLGKIQTILFGEQSHRFETQLAEMADKFDRAINQTTSEFTARINALETEHNRRLEKLNKDLNDKATALDTAKLDSKEAGRILSAAAEKISRS